ncbi:MAG: TIGR04551 family protein [Polyangiaceae bacterium]
MRARTRIQAPLASLAALAVTLYGGLAAAQQAAGPGAATEPPKTDPGTTSSPTPEAKKTEPEISTYERSFADDWFSKARPSFELHGYYRVRSELYANFDLGRRDDPASSLWPQPASDDYTYIDARTRQIAHNEVALCGDDPSNPQPCSSITQGGANMRLRVTPVLTISDNLRAFAQLDLFDNMLLGSTPDGYVNQPSSAGGYEVRQRGGYTPIGAFSATQWSTTGGQNSLTDSIVVKRAWGEYISPIGTFKFGRMPNHWGLGMVYNSGDGIDSDTGSTADRIQVKLGLPEYDLYLVGMWDFADEGVTGGAYYGCQQAARGCDAAEQTAQRYELEGKRYDPMQSDDMYQWGVAAFRQRDPNRARLELARGQVVVNGGVYFIYRNQFLESRSPLGANPREQTENLVRRGYEAFIPDAYGELMWDKLRIAVEAALVWGSIENTNVFGAGESNFDNPDVPSGDEDGWKLRQFGIAFESSYRTLEDRLRFDFGFGYATGDADVEGLDGYGPGSVYKDKSPLNGLDRQLTSDRTYSTFRFHPDYRIDQILWRRIIGGVQSAYYFKPGIAYDVIRNADGMRAGGGLNVVWSRAAQPVQAPGNEPDLGVELDTSIFFQGLGSSYDAKGNPTTGFYAQLDYAVLFPLDGLGYLPGEQRQLGADSQLSIAHMLRLFMGVLY